MSDALPRVKWAVIDGLPYFLLLKYLDCSTMPNLNRLMKAGLITPLEPLWPNCQTPPSLFSIWSGQPATMHQIWGFDTPDGTEAGAFRNGFTHWPAGLEMVWETWGRAGHPVRLNHVPFVDETKLGDRLVARSTIYGEQGYDSSVFTHSTCFDVGAYRLTLSLQSINDQQTLLHIGGEGFKQIETLNLEVFSDIRLPDPLDGILTIMAFPGRDGTLRGAVLGKNCYRRSGKKPGDTGHPPGDDFCHASLAKQYRQGALGRKKELGGNGDAERRLFASLARVHQSFYQELVASFSRRDADLTVGYYPVIDLALHEILNIEFLALHDSAVAGYFRQIMLWAESLVAALVDSCREGERLIINSDHGMQPIFDTFYLNHYLALHGWLTFDAHGGIDYANTRAAYHPAENGTLMIREESEAHQVVERICALFTEWGYEGAKVERLSVDSEQQGFWTCWFLLPPDGVRVKAGNSATVIVRSDKAGDHCGYSSLPDLKGTLISNCLGPRPALMHMYEIKSFVIGN